MTDRATIVDRDTVLRQLQERPGIALQDYERAALTYWGYVDQVRYGGLTLDALVLTLEEARRNMLAHHSAEWVPPPVEESSLLPHNLQLPTDNDQMAHSYAASRILATRAARTRQVMEFRMQHIGHDLLPFPQVDAWIKARAEREGPAGYWLMDAPVSALEVAQRRDDAGYTTVERRFYVPIPDPRVPEDETWHGPRLIEHRLYYFRFSSRGQQEIRIAAGGVLEQLDFLADDLHEKYDWSWAQATTFVLTGMVPRVNYFKRVSMSVGLNSTIEEVTAAFKFARRTLIGARWRALSIKSLQLAVFTAEIGESAASADRMKAWNQMYPEWSYTHAGHFAQDSSDALRRLMREAAPEPLGLPRQRRQPAEEDSRQAGE